MATRHNAYRPTTAQLGGRLGECAPLNPNAQPRSCPAMAMTRKEFWERHDALTKRRDNGTAVPPSNPEYDKEGHFALHREYYGQWARYIGPLPSDLLRRCKDALDAGDQNMNSPYTSLKEWDDMQFLTKGRFAEDHGTWKGWSLSFNTCVLKEAARLQLEAAAERGEA